MDTSQGLQVLQEKFLVDIELTKSLQTEAENSGAEIVLPWKKRQDRGQVKIPGKNGQDQAGCCCFLYDNSLKYNIVL